MRGWVIVALSAALMAAPPPQKKTRVYVPVWPAADAKVEAQNLAATLNGEKARVVDVRAPGEDLLLVLVLDVTGDLATVDPAREALVAEVNKLPENCRVAVMRAQDGLSVVLDPSADRAAIAEAIRGVPSAGKAGLLETVEDVEKVADAVLTKYRVRASVLYVTDSDIGNYREDFTNPVINSSDSSDLSRRFPEGLIQDKITRLTAKVATRQAPLFIVHLDYRSDRLNEAYQIGLKKLAQATAGTAEFCRSLADIPGTMDTAFRRIVSHYAVAIELPAKPKKVLEIELTETGKDKSSLSYRTRIAWKQE